MGWVDGADDVAAKPRLSLEDPTDTWDGDLDPDRGWAELTDTRIDGGRFDLTGCEEVSLSGVHADGVVVDPDDVTTVEAWRSTLRNCDLSGVSFTSLRSCSFVGSKFVGTELAEARLIDVRFERCTFRYSNFRRAKMERVEFADCSLVDVDMDGATLEDVGFASSRLSQWHINSVRAERVDLRDVAELDIASFSRLDGFVVGEDQLPTLMYALAFAVGLGVEQPADG